MSVRWQDLEEFPDYAVSDQGEVCNIKTGVSRRMSINQYGIVKISLYKNGRELITRSLAIMVAEAFVEGQSEHFNTPMHLDGDRENCRADNLVWRPRWFVIQYHRQFHNPKFHEEFVNMEELKTGNVYHSIKEACMDLGLLYNDVYRSLTNDRMIPLTRHEFRPL